MSRRRLRLGSVFVYRYFGRRHTRLDAERVRVRPGTVLAGIYRTLFYTVRVRYYYIDHYCALLSRENRRRGFYGKLKMAIVFGIDD